MARITLLCDHCAFVKPRSARLLALLDSMRYELSLIHKGEPRPAPPYVSARVKLLHFPADKSSKERSAEENAAIARACVRGEFKSLIHTPNRAIIPHLLDSLPRQDLLIVEDITLLPFACAYKAGRGAKILIDLREYYPLEYEGDSAWMAGLGQFFAYLCEAYLPQVDCALSVSEGLCARYRAEYGIACELYYSLPPYFAPNVLGLESLGESAGDFALDSRGAGDFDAGAKDFIRDSRVDCGGDFHADFCAQSGRLESRRVDSRDSKLRLLYHGFISPDRSSMELLELARALDSRRFSLSLMVLSNQKGFLEEFAREAKGIESLRLLPPVSLESIIPASVGYDIGLIPFKPTSFNLMQCMPNKLFEYIQARLCVVSTPLDSMRGFLARYEVGRLAGDFSIAALVEAIHALSYEDIAGYKRASHRYAYELSLESNAPRIRRIIEGCLSFK